MKKKFVLFKRNKLLYLPIIIFFIGLIVLTYGTYSYYKNVSNGTATATVLTYSCTENGSTSFNINDLTNMHPGSNEVRMLNLEASIYSSVKVEVTSYSNMNDSIHPNLALYNDENHLNKMLTDGTNYIETNVYPGRVTNVPIYIYWPYDANDEYNAADFSATLSVTCTQKTMPAICQRVKSVGELHTETCKNSDASYYCQADGYALNSTITYGTIWDGSSALKTGDAFDCDVNGNGVVDQDGNGKSTERFYYISDKWNEGTNKNSFDSSIAVLVYYRNFQNGVPADGGSEYATNGDIQNLGYTCNETNGCNWYGPITAKKHLPQTTGSSAWRSDLLMGNTTTIYSCSNQNCDALSSETTGGTIINPLNYGTTTAARLLTLPEVVKGCRAINGNTSLVTGGSLTACKFLFERTRYSYQESSWSTYGPWLISPRDSSTYYVWYAYSGLRGIYRTHANSVAYGVRPAIEVAKNTLH